MDPRLHERHGLPAAGATAGAGSPSAWGLGFEGRLGRLGYASAGLWMLTALYLLVVFVLLQPGFGRLGLASLAGLAILFLSIRAGVLRCHDCNRSGWWSLSTAVPYVGLAASLLLSSLPGTPHDNDFGPQPPPGSWLQLGASVLVLLLCVGFSANIVMHRMMSGLT